MHNIMAAGKLIEDATTATGLSDFGESTFQEGLDVLVSDINRTERTDAAFKNFRDEIVEFLSRRLKVTDWLKQRPAITQASVARPVVVMGIPRTGTTLTSNLLAADPNRRSLLKWEEADPVPPPTTATLYNDPRALAALSAEKKMLAANPAAGRMYRSSAVYPTEDIFPMSQDFKSLFWESHGPLPAYQEWLLGCDMRSAYRYHKKYLQLLQSEAPGVWNLKMPSHVLYIDALLDVYPDARLVWTHRDPITATASLCSLISKTHSVYLGRVDKEWIGSNYPNQAALHAERAMESRARIGHDKIYDLYYADMIRDPIAAMQKLYDWLGDDWTEEAEKGMSNWISANPQGKFGKHIYKLDDYDLTVEGVAGLFEDYLSQYDVEMDG